MAMHHSSLQSRLLLTLLLLATNLFAHSDPPGYVHPRVCVENGEFAIYTHRNSGTLGRLLWRRTCYAIDGRLINSKDEVREPKNSIVQRAQPLATGEKITLIPDVDVQGEPNSDHGFYFDFMDAGKRFRKPLPPSSEDAVTLEATLITDTRAGFGMGENRVMALRSERGWICNLLGSSALVST